MNVCCSCMSPPVHPKRSVGDERSRGGRGGLSESTCFLRGMWETGTVVASLMSLGSVRYKHRTHTHTEMQARTNTHLHTKRFCALGEPRFESAFKWCCAKSPYIIVRIYIKRLDLHKCSHIGTKHSRENIQVAWVVTPSHTHTPPRLTHIEHFLHVLPHIPSHTTRRPQSYRKDITRCSYSTWTWWIKACDWRLGDPRTKSGLSGAWLH